MGKSNLTREDWLSDDAISLLQRLDGARGPVEVKDKDALTALKRSGVRLRVEGNGPLVLVTLS